MAKRRGRGEGAIRKRSPELWEARVSLGHDGEGKRKTRSVYGKTKAEVQEKLRGLQDAAATGGLAEPSSLTLGQYLQTWLADVAKPRLSPTTYERHEGLIRLHITPHIGGIKLQKLQPLHVTHLSGALAAAGESLWTRKMCGTLLHNALRHAVRMRLIPSNPAADVPRAKPAEREMTILTDEQVRTLLATAKGHRLYALLATALGAGMRQGELLGLAWEDVDLDKGTIVVRRSLAQLGGKSAAKASEDKQGLQSPARPKGKFVIKTPKSKQSRRTIKLPGFVVEALKTHGRTSDRIVFATTTGTYQGKSNMIRQFFKPMLKRAGVPEIRFHDLRHTHASMLLSHGMSLKAVSQRLGHSSVELTLRVYVHLLPGADDVLAEKVGEVWG